MSTDFEKQRMKKILDKESWSQTRRWKGPLKMHSDSYKNRKRRGGEGGY